MTYEDDEVKAIPRWIIFLSIEVLLICHMRTLLKQTEQDSTKTILPAEAFCNKIQSKGTWYHTT